jgi:hypothetical protein
MEGVPPWMGVSMSAMPVTFPECCVVGCATESAWGFKDQGGDPYADNYCCSEHLPDMIGLGVTLVWPISLEWPKEKRNDD